MIRVSEKTAHRSGSPWMLAFLAVAPVVAASLLGQAVTTPNLAPWYASLAKPAFNPPNWIFAPVWTALYAMMAYAFWRVLRSPVGRPQRPRAILLFLAQIALNAAWSVAFFGMQNPVLGLIVILALAGAIVATISAFMILDAVAGWLLLPYLVWVAFATLLNASIWLLN